MCVSQDSAVSVGTQLRSHLPKKSRLISGKTRDLYFLLKARLLQGPRKNNHGSSGVKRPGNEIDRFNSPIDEAKNARICTSIQISSLSRA